MFTTDPLPPCPPKKKKTMALNPFTFKSDNSTDCQDNSTPTDGHPYREISLIETKGEMCDCFACGKSVKETDCIKINDQRQQPSYFFCSEECEQFIKEFSEYRTLRGYIINDSSRKDPFHVHFTPSVSKKGDKFIASFGDVSGIADTPSDALRNYDRAWNLTSGELTQKFVDQISFFNAFDCKDEKITKWRDNRNKFLDNIKLMKKLLGKDND